MPSKADSRRPEREFGALGGLHRALSAEVDNLTAFNLDCEHSLTITLHYCETCYAL